MAGQPSTNPRARLGLAAVAVVFDTPAELFERGVAGVFVSLADLNDAEDVLALEMLTT